jgi:DNA-binding response OmpR family regulator
VSWSFCPGLLVASMNVLIIENDFLTAELMRSALTAAGHLVLGPTTSAQLGLQLAEACHPHVAFLDIDLGRDRPDGIFVARQLFTRFGVHSLFITGNVHLARREQEAGLGVLAKPFDWEVVVQVARVVEGVLKDGSPSTWLPPQLELFRGVPANE